jgi:YVTN family beta-propeller protein
MPSTAALVLAVVSGSAGAIDWTHPDGDPARHAQVLPASRAAAWPVELGPPGPVGFGARGPAPAAGFVLTGSDPEGDAPSDVAFTPDGQTIVIAHRESGNLILWDADTRAFAGEVVVTGAPQALAITPDGQRAVVTGINTQTVSIVSLASLTETGVIPVGNVPASASISPDGARAAVHCAFDGATHIINLASGSVERVIPGIDTWSRLSFSIEAPAVNVQYGGPEFIDNARLINVDLGAGEVQFINAATGAVNRLPVADSPFGLAISADGSTAVITHSGSSRTITVVDLAAETVSDTLATTFDLWGPVAVNTDGTRAAVAVQNAARVIDLTTGAPVGFQADTASLNDMKATFDGQFAVGIGFRGPVLSFATGAMVAQTNNAVSTDIGAVSPTDFRAAMCSTTFGDDLVVVSTNGASGALESFQLSGPLAEGDRCRTAAISADGSVAVGVSIFSDTATIIDVASGSVTGFAPVGQRPSGVAITPDGARAVVANLDSSFVSVVDLASATTTNINISTRGSQVEISPDGRYAYIPVVANGDGVWRINLDTLAVDGAKLLTGNMGGVGYSYSQSSGIDLSPDGTRLAVAGSFDNVVTLIDTVSWTVDRTIAVGSFPTVVAFNANGTRLFASNRNDDTVSIIDMTLPAPAVTGTVNVGDQPGQLVPDPDGVHLYVNAWGASRIDKVNLTFPVLVDTQALPDLATGLALDAAEGLLYAASGNSATTLGGELGYSRSEDGRLTALDTASLSPAGTIELGFAPAGLEFDAARRYAIAPCPTADGAVLVRFDGPCNAADIAEPFGTLDLADISAFIVAFTGNDPAADLAPPFGTFDLADLQAFIVAFTGGCP